MWRTFIGRREDHAQADWAELDAIDDHRERFSPRSIAPEIVAKAIRYRQRCWHVLWFQAGVLQHSRNRPWLGKHRRRLGRDQMFQLSCRNAPSAGVLLSRFRLQRTRHIVAISPPRFCRMTGGEPMASLIEHLSDQWAARASCPSSLLWGCVTELVLHAVPCLAIENCLVLPAVAGALVRDLDRQTWDSVQDQLRDAAPEQRGRATGPRSPLIGKVFDEAGHRLTPSHATKAGRRYRYYVSRPLVTETAKQHPGAWRIPATQLEHLIATEAAAMLAEPGAIAAVLENAGLEPEQVPAALAIADRFRDDLGRDAARGEALAVVVNRIELSPIRLRVILSAAALMPANPDAADAQEAVLVRDISLRIKRRGVEMRLIIEGLSAVPRNADPVLLKEIRRAHRCFEALVSGQVRSVAELATVEGISDRYVSSLLPLALLAPDIVEAVAAGRQPPELTAHRLIRSVDLPTAWA